MIFGLLAEQHLKLLMALFYEMICCSLPKWNSLAMWLEGSDLLQNFACNFFQMLECLFDEIEGMTA